MHLVPQKSSELPVPSSSAPPPVSVWGMLRGVLVASMFAAAVSAGFVLEGYTKHLAWGVSPVRPVNPLSCTCDCFDGVNKGMYFNPRGAMYKSIYINHDGNAAKIAAWFVLHAAAVAYLCGRVSDVVAAGRLSWGAFIAIGFAVYPIQYGFGSVAHYWNDRILYLLPTQMFFSVTNVVYAVPIYHALDTQVALPEVTVVAAQAMLSSHILIALWEQGWEHLTRFNTASVLIARDGMFLLCDAVMLVFLVQRFSRPRTKRACVVFAGTVFATLAVFRLVRG